MKQPMMKFRWTENAASLLMSSFPFHRRQEDAMDMWISLTGWRLIPLR